MNAPARIKEEVHRLADTLPDNASWEDVMERIYVRQAIERGLADSEAGCVSTTEEVRARLGLER